MEGKVIKAFMNKITVILIFVTMIMIGIYVVSELVFFKTLAIAFGTTFYHFAMRLLIGFIYQLRCNNNISWENSWFQVNTCEMKIYKILKVKSWKKYIPTYDSGSFDIKTKSYEQIAMAMCQAELVHETIIIFSFLPIIASVWFGSVEVFVITSIISALIDLIFVILQRYNRPRVLKIIKITTDKKNKYTQCKGYRK